MAHYINTVKADINTSFAVEDGKEVVQVLALALFLVGNLVGQLDTILRTLRDHLTCNDECIIAEYFLQEVLVLLVVSSTEAFHIV